MTHIWQKGYHRIQDTFHGPMMYNTNDKYIGKCLEHHGKWGWEEIEKTLPYASGTVLDIGANIGTHTLSYARKAKQVISFEPLAGMFNLLCANIALNCLENVAPFPFAIGNFNGLIPIGTPDYSIKQNFGCYSVGVGDTNCPIRTIDSFHLKSITLMKIDVEGHEMEVLQGALETIARCRPVVYMENDRTDKQLSLVRLMESLDYAWEWHRTPIGSSFPDVYSINMLCLPKSIEVFDFGKYIVATQRKE